MADGKIKISELNEALQIDDNAEFPYAQENGGVQTTFKGPVSQIARKIAEGITFTNLETTAKTLVGAINELSHLGNPIIIGTTAPTSSQGADGNIYVQYTEGTGGDPDTVDSIYAKIDGAWCEIETGGGGGSGGHTVVDDSGTALTQRTNLQFNGAYSEDNATDDTTEIDVVREMTKAEFDELTEAEKKGLINITDITGGNDDRFQPVIYSEDEREIGVWIDGKPLYERVIDLGADTSIGYNSWTLTTVSLSEIDRLILIQGLNSAGTAYYGDLLGGNNNGYLQLLTGRNEQPVSVQYLIFRYTKSTDTAGSGQWTPQGVPAVHYSEDEQVVGTWIDGSALYEKTYYYTSSTVPAQSTPITIADVSSLSIDNNVSIETTYSITHKTNGTLFWFSINDCQVQLENSNLLFYQKATSAPDTYEDMRVNITIRYTKSST